MIWLFHFSSFDECVWERHIEWYARITHTHMGHMYEHRHRHEYTNTHTHTYSLRALWTFVFTWLAPHNGAPLTAQTQHKTMTKTSTHWIGVCQPYFCFALMFNCWLDTLFDVTSVAVLLAFIVYVHNNFNFNQMNWNFFGAIRFYVKFNFALKIWCMPKTEMFIEMVNVWAIEWIEF